MLVPMTATLSLPSVDRTANGVPLAPFATQAAHTRGRLHKEKEASSRSPFQRDRDRIIHSGAFRRLEYKTQVFVNHEGDYYRTRLTHSLEVAQLARAMARELRVDEDLAEAFALAHDLGHTPFGHAGEEALDEAMQPFGGFDHNAQTLRVLTRLEARYPDFDGLNLTWETLEGMAKHNGPLLCHGRTEQDLPRAMREYNAVHDLELHTWPGIEAQVAALADDVAYNSHDIDDGLRAGLFTLEQLKALPFVGDVVAEAVKAYPRAKQSVLIHEIVRRIIGAMVRDIVQESRRRIEVAGVAGADEVRAQKKALVSFSAEMDGYHKALKTFLMKNMYRHYRVNRMTSKARRVVRELFTVFLNEPGCLPPEWQAGGAGTPELAVAVADYVAGMTDRFAMQEHKKLYDLSTVILAG